MLFTVQTRIMTPIQTKRRDRLKALVENFGGPAAFARNNSQANADKPIDATYVSQLCQGHRAFGEKAARAMELRAGLPYGYFDSDAETSPLSYRVSDRPPAPYIDTGKVAVSADEVKLLSAWRKASPDLRQAIMAIATLAHKK